MCKMSCILPLVATLVVLVAGDCIPDASQSASKGLFGGYRRIEDPEKNDVVKKIVADSIALRNRGIWAGFSYLDDDHYVAYRQIVNGEIYCCQFRIKGRLCKTEVSSLHCPKQELVCSVKALKPFSQAFATIDGSSLKCTEGSPA